MVKMKNIHKEKDFLCPRCSVKMKKWKKNDVIIDVCPSCEGMWLDKGEIEKLVEMRKVKA